MQDALAKGARALTGGAAAEGPGFFYPPTVLTGVTHEMAIMREETFGPVLPVMEVDSLEQAIALANDSPYGLTASGWTRSEETARRLQRELVAGVVSINDHASSFGEPTAPWGGVKWSGIGRTHGLLGLREMVQPKYVSADHGRGAELWWYPYDAQFAALMRHAAPALYATSAARRIAAPGRDSRASRGCGGASARFASRATSTSSSDRGRHLPALALAPPQVALPRHGRGADRRRRRADGGLAGAGRAGDGGPGQPRAGGRLRARQHPLAAADRRSGADRAAADPRGAAQRAPVELRQRRHPRAEDAGGLAQALPRHARVPRGAGGAPGRVLPHDAPRHRPPQHHDQQRAQRGHVHGPADRRAAAARPGAARAARRRADADALPAPGRRRALQGAAQPARGRRRTGPRDGSPQPARQRRQVLEGQGRGGGRGVGGRRWPGSRPRSETTASA